MAVSATRVLADGGNLGKRCCRVRLYETARSDGLMDRAIRPYRRIN